MANAEKLKTQLHKHGQYPDAPPEPEQRRLSPEDRQAARDTKFAAPKTKPGEQDEDFTSAEELSQTNKPGELKSKPLNGVQAELARMRRNRR